MNSLVKCYWAWKVLGSNCFIRRTC